MNTPIETTANMLADAEHDARSLPGPNATAGAEDRPRRINPTPMLNRQECREFLLAAAKQHRPFNKFTRVSEETLVRINAAVRLLMIDHVKRMPSKGRG